MIKNQLKYFQAYFNEIHPAYKLLFTLFFSITSVFVGIFIGSLFALPFWGYEDIINALTNQNTEESNIGILKYYQIIQSISMFIIPPIVIGILDKNSPSTFLNLKTPINLLSIVFTFVIMLSVIPVVNYLGAINAELSFPSCLEKVEQYFIEMENQAKVITDKYLAMENAGQLLFNIFMIGIIPAIGEEFIFRGVVQKYLSQWFGSPQLAIWIAAIIFSAFHFQFFGFIPRLVLGATFGYLYYFSKNIWLPILAHFLNNTFAIIAYFFFNHQLTQSNPDQIGIEVNPFIILGNAFFVIGMIVFIKKLENRIIKN